MHPLTQRSQVNTTTGGPSTSTTALAAFNDRVGFFIQNQAAAVLFGKFGAGCTTSNYDFILKASGTAADGSGAIMSMNGPMVYTGVITVAASGTPSYTAEDW